MLVGLLIVLRTPAESSCWVVSFFAFSPCSSDDHGATIFLLELSLGLVMLGLTFLLTDSSDAFDSASDILPVSSSEMAGISSFSSSSLLLLSMLSSSFFKLLLVPFLFFRKLLSQPRRL